MRHILYWIALGIGLIAIIGFAVGWIGPTHGEGWGRGWYNVIMMIGSGIMSLIMAVLLGIVRLTGKNRDQATDLFVISIGINILPILGVLLMFIGIIRIH